MLRWTHPLCGADLLNSPQPQILMPLGSLCTEIAALPTAPEGTSVTAVGPEQGQRPPAVS